MSRKFKKGSRIEVTWGDAWGSNGWTEVNQEKDCNPMTVKSVGYFIFQNKKGVLTASSIDGNKYNGLHFVPKGMIRSIKKV